VPGIYKDPVSRFSSLGKINKDLYKKLLNLPFITREEKFENILSELMKPEVLTESEKEYLEKRQTKRNMGKMHGKKSFCCRRKYNFQGGRFA